MHLVYVDDSVGEATYQLMVAVIIPDKEFRAIEGYLALLIDQCVPENERDVFEFHASALFHGKPPFENIGHDKAIEIFENCTTITALGTVPISYGAVDLRRLRSGLYATAHPHDIAFRLCLEGVEKMFCELAKKKPNTNPIFHDFGLLICDDTKNQGVKQDLQKAFRANRRILRSEKGSRGRFDHFHDDMYFGNSASSVGIQLADIYAFLILRHLEGKQDTEFLYKKIEPYICFGKVEPENHKE